MSLYHFSRHNSSVFFQLKRYTISTKVAIKVQIFRLSAARVKVHQIPHVIFQTKSQFFFKVWISFQCHERSFSCTFLAETLYAIDKSSTSKYKFSDLPLLTLKFTKFLMLFLEPRVSFPSNFALLFSVMRHNSSVYFSSKSSYALDKRSSSKCEFPYF